MEKKVEILEKKEWNAPSLDKLEVIKTLGGNGIMEDDTGGSGPKASGF
jgi:hypothetical protein